MSEPEKPRRLVGPALVALTGTTLGLWLGERGSLLTGLTDLAIVAALAGASLVVAGGRPRRRALAAASCLGVFFAAWVVGVQEWQAAFNLCVTEGESIRIALADFQHRTGRFPASIAELPGGSPCRRAIRGSIISYHPTTAGYEAAFGDRFVTHTATDAHPFQAHK